MPIDSTAKIAGPGFASYNAAAYRTFFTYCKTNNCVPDITTWHELDGSLYNDWYTRYNNYRQIEIDLGIGKHEIFINEYARSSGDLGVPGNLIQYISRFETSKVYGSLALWTGVGDLNDLVANNKTSQSVPGISLNLPTGAWYLYHWYGQMTGNTVGVTLPSTNGSLRALASKSGNTVKVLFGGSNPASAVYDMTIKVSGVSGGTATISVTRSDQIALSRMFRDIPFRSTL